jgi:glycosyltransferase involved in cell wall biosynthesis
MMKIASAGPAPPWRGGIAHYHFALAEQLVAEGAGVSVLNFARLYPRLLFPGTTAVDLTGSALPDLGERVLRPLWPPSWRRAARLITVWESDVVLCQWWHPFFAPAYLGLLRRIPPGIPVGLICHNVLSHEGMPGGRRLTEKIIRRADFVITGGREMAEEIGALNHHAAVEVVAHPRYDMPFTGGLPTREEAREQLALDLDETVFLFFGLVRRYKGLDLLLEALARIGTDTRWTCLVAGEFYESRGPYDLLIRNAGLEDRIRIIDRYLPNAEVPVVFAASDLTVLPYRQATQSGVAALSLALRRPVLTTRVGALPESIVEGENGWLVPPDDPAALAGVLREIARDRRLADLPVTGGDAGLPEWGDLARTVIRLASGAGGMRV